MKKMLFIFLMSCFSLTANSNFATSKSYEIPIDEFKEAFLDPEEDCRRAVTAVIRFLKYYSSETMRDLVKLETELLINCFDANM